MPKGGSKPSRGPAPKGPGKMPPPGPMKGGRDMPKMPMMPKKGR